MTTYDDNNTFQKNLTKAKKALSEIEVRAGQVRFDLAVWAREFRSTFKYGTASEIRQGDEDFIDCLQRHFDKGVHEAHGMLTRAIAGSVFRDIHKFQAAGLHRTDFQIVQLRFKSRQEQTEIMMTAATRSLTVSSILSPRQPRRPTAADQATTDAAEFAEIILRACLKVPPEIKAKIARYIKSENVKRPLKSVA